MRRTYTFGVCSWKRSFLSGPRTNALQTYSFQSDSLFGSPSLVLVEIGPLCSYLLLSLPVDLISEYYSCSQSEFLGLISLQLRPFYQALISERDDSSNLENQS